MTVDAKRATGVCDCDSGNKLRALTKALCEYPRTQLVAKSFKWAGPAVLAIALSLPTPGAANWYEQARFSCADPFGVMALLRNSGWLKAKLPLEFVSVSQGIVYADLGAAQVGQNPALRSDGQAFNRIALSADQANQIRMALEQADQSKAVPLFVQNLPSLAGYWVTSTSSLVISGVFSFLFDQVGAQRLNAAQLRPLMATGGDISEVVTLKFVDGKHVLLSTFAYDVKVGEETRHIWLAGCTYPASVSHKAFRTTVGVNDKLLIHETGNWYLENLATGDRDPGHFKRVAEDEDFLYLKGHGVSAFYEDYRIAKYGGPFEVNDEGAWTVLYKTSEPE